MNLQQLTTFLSVAETGSFTEASRHLSLSQPAVSRQMAVLEQELGTKLFTREHSTIALTIGGKYLQEQLSALLPKLQLAFEETARMGSGETGRLRIGLLEDQCLDGTISAALRKLKQEQIYLSIQRLNFQELEAKLLSGEIDIAISIEQNAQALSGCRRKIYAAESMCLAIHRSHIPPEGIAPREDILTTLTEACPILMPSLNSFQRRQRDALSDMMAKGSLRSQEYDFASISPMVGLGLATTIVNESHNLSIDHAVALLPLEDLPRINKGIFWLPGNHNPMIQRLEQSLLAP